MELNELPIIDTHQHVWDLDKIELPWVRDPAYGKLARSFLLSEYREASAGLNIVKTIYLEVDARPADQLAEARYVFDLSQFPDSRIAGAIIGGHPNAGDFDDYMHMFANNVFVKGVREVLFDRPQTHCLEDAFIRSIRELGKANLLFEIEAPAAYLRSIQALVEECPETKFVIDHCGHPDLTTRNELWRDNMAALAENPNVVTKISGIFSGAPRDICCAEVIWPIVDFLFEMFGSDRLVFGSDWPVITLTSSFREWAEAVWQTVRERDDDDICKLFHDNAVRVYRLGAN